MPVRRTAALLVSLALGIGLAVAPAVARATTDDPVPIPGGFETGLPPPDGPIAHVLAPGPTEIGDLGLAVEPNTITNFDGFSALAYLNGTATGADRTTYAIGLSDMRVFRGTYVTADGSIARGTFAFI
jgi:hypothetical protein